MTRIFIALALFILGWFCWPTYETPYQVSPEIEQAAERMIAEWKR